MKLIFIIILFLVLINPLLAFAKQRDYSILQNTHSCVSILIDPKVYSSTIYSGYPSHKFQITINANYYDPETGLPIGLLRDNYSWLKYIYEYTDIRPCLMFDKYNKATISIKPWPYSKIKTMIQAGPTLIHKGKSFYNKNSEKFQDDTVRRTRQVSIGITSKNKLLILYTEDWSISKIITYLLDNNCVEAFKLDGGHSAHLTFIPDKDDTKNKAIYRGNQHVYCGLAFTRKN